jgi:hypothetical protein
MATSEDSALGLVFRCSESFDHLESAVYFGQRFLRSLHIAWKQHRRQLATIVRDDVDFTNWAPLGPGNIRGPCPAMKRMANHQIIPHHGLNLTIPILADDLAKNFNLSIEMVQSSRA